MNNNSSGELTESVCKVPTWPYESFFCSLHKSFSRLQYVCYTSPRLYQLKIWLAYRPQSPIVWATQKSRKTHERLNLSFYWWTYHSCCECNSCNRDLELVRTEFFGWLAGALKFVAAEFALEHCTAQDGNEWRMEIRFIVNKFPL